MIDIMFTPALPCGIGGPSCKQTGTAGLLIEDLRLHGGIWLRPICLGCLSSITAESRATPIAVNLELQPSFQTLVLKDLVSCPGIATYRERFRMPEHYDLTSAAPCMKFANIAIVRPIGGGLWDLCVVCPTCALTIGITEHQYT